MKPVIKPSILVLPYNKKQPIRTYNNRKGESLFIRAKLFEKNGSWFATVNPNGAVPVEPDDDQDGVIVFVPRALQQGEAVLIDRVLPSGNCAKGTPVKLPDDWICPMEVELSNLSI